METARSDTGLLHLQWQHTVEPILVMAAFSGDHLRVTFNGSIQWSPS